MRIVLLSDGTGNAASKVWRTNVWRTFESIDLSDSTQVAFYDDGVGTSSFKPLAIMGGAFGWGLKRNVIDIYKFLCRNYKSDEDEVFGFGFSRGAFTMRVVLGLTLNQGLVSFKSESELDALARAAYRAYRAERFHTIFRVEAFFRFLRDLVIRSSYDKSKNRQVASIRFVGLWDTVAAYGLPIDEMTRGVSRWLWPLELPDHRLSEKVLRACHALSLDDERTTFHPELWDETSESELEPQDGKYWTKNERISQVWFAGVHSNVGGGYPDDSLALVPMYWIMKEAQECGLKFKVRPNADPDALVHAHSSRDKDGRLYDSRQGLGGYYRYGPRKLMELCQSKFSPRRRDRVWIDTPKIHESALKRIEIGAHKYAPIGLPAKYNVVTDAGEVVSLGPHAFESGDAAQARSQRQEFIWNLVWWKRVVYFLTVAASAYLALYPLFRRPASEGETSSILRPISDLIRLIGSFLPDAVDIWINGYARSPEEFLLAGFLVGALIYLGVRLGGKITDQMRSLWLSKGGSGDLQPSDFIFRLRTCDYYQRALRAMKYYIAPSFFALFFLYLGLALTSHLVFNFADATGWTCQSSQNPTKLEVGLAHQVTVVVPVNSLCFSTGIFLVKDGQYQIRTVAEGPWTAGSDEINARGYYFSEVKGFWNILNTALLTPLRRAWFRPWHRMIARIGKLGSEEKFLDPNNDFPGPVTLQEVDTATQDGELFFYVNDAVVSIPGFSDFFYRKNRGTARITIRRVK